MKRTRIPVVIVIVLLVLLAGGFAAARYISRYLPSGEQADISSLYDLSGEEAVLFYNDRPADVRAVIRDNQAYLPLGWVNENLNEKFYWDDTEKLLVYTLPDAVVYADRRTAGNSGSPLLLAEEDGVYLSLSLIGSYTDIRFVTFAAPGAGRVFVDDDWSARQVGTVKRDTPVRVEADIKSPVLTTVGRDGQAVILESGGEWDKVRTDDGFIGYLQAKRIAATQTSPRISTFSEPEYTSLSMDEKVCLVWHQVLDEKQNDDLEQLIAGTKGVNVVAPTWLMLTDNNGNYSSYASREYVDKAHELGLQVWAVLDNFNKGGQVDSAVLFARTSVRRKLIAGLMEEVRDYGLDGLNLDIEGISQEAMPHYVQFIRELSVECRKNGIFLSVDNYVPSEYTAAYNRAEQGRVADYVIIMGYDEHYSGGEPGSVASLPFVEKGIRDTLSLVPAEKVINAVPFYTRRWTTENGEVTSAALGMDAAAAWVEENDVPLYWQEELGQYYGELREGNAFHMIWMEDERSLRLKMDLIREYDLAGVACWKLGLETESVWDIIKT